MTTTEAEAYNIRHTAIDFATRLQPGIRFENGAALIAEAKKIEAYLKGDADVKKCDQP